MGGANCEIHRTYYGHTNYREIAHEERGGGGWEREEKRGRKEGAKEMRQRGGETQREGEGERERGRCDDWEMGEG